MAAGIASGFLLAGCAGSGSVRPAGPAGPPAAIPFHLTSADRAESCQTATASGSATSLVSAFRAARLAGYGAEGCLTSTALSRYCGPRPCGPELFSGPKAPSPGPICLYSCNGQTVTAIALEGAEKDHAGSIWVSLVVSSHGGSGSSTTIDSEELRLGPGVPSTGSERQPMVIVDASTSG